MGALIREHGEGRATPEKLGHPSLCLLQIVSEGLATKCAGLTVLEKVPDRRIVGGRGDPQNLDIVRPTAK
jgi:hypothetical protein